VKPAGQWNSGMSPASWFPCLVCPGPWFSAFCTEIAGMIGSGHGFAMTTGYAGVFAPTQAPMRAPVPPNQAEFSPVLR